MSLVAEEKRIISRTIRK